MPFPTFHLAAGLPLLRNRRVFAGYVAANILIDLEPAYTILTTGSAVHGMSHTFVFALMLYGLVVFTTGLFGLDRGNHFERGVLIGGVAHILLDSMIHVDMRPFHPFESNPLYGLLTWGQVEWLCLALAAAAILQVDHIRRLLADVAHKTKLFLLR